MNTVRDEDGRELLGHVLLPVASEDDATESARALAPYAPTRVTALHVVEKGEGAIDKTPVEQSREIAERSFAAVRKTFPDADDHIAYDSDIVAGIFGAAEETGASAIAFRPRGGSRVIQLLTGDRTLDLVTENERPVIALPRDPDSA